MSVIGSVLGRRREERPISRWLAAALPLVSIATFAIVVVAVVWAAMQAGTLGNDYLAYDGAVRRFLAGGPLYDQSPDVAGGFRLYLYSPPFALLAIPLAALAPATAALVFTGLLVVAFPAAVLVMPVPLRVRWVVLFLGGISWPLVYSIKLGQVGPILLLLFALGWRWLDKPARFGLTTALGVAIKVQPALLLGWALLTRRTRAFWWGLAGVAVLAVVATIVAGPNAWLDQARLLARVSQPILTPHNFTPGRIAYELGASETAAWAVQIANWVACAVIVLYAIWRASAVASYMAVVIASQLVSPILWDHYALILLLPVAWLISRGWWWTAVVPLATSIVLIGLVPTAVYPIAFWVTLVAVVVLGRLERQELDSTYEVPRPVPYPTA
jgi:hypothetical protein